MYLCEDTIFLGKMTEFKLTTEYIELIRLLKAARVVSSGGEARQVVEDELVKVNGAIELRKRAKLRKGDLVEAFDKQIKIC